MITVLNPFQLTRLNRMIYNQMTDLRKIELERYPEAHVRTEKPRKLTIPSRQDPLASLRCWELYQFSRRDFPSGTCRRLTSRPTKAVAGLSQKVRHQPPALERIHSKFSARPTTHNDSA